MIKSTIIISHVTDSLGKIRLKKVAQFVTTALSYSSNDFGGNHKESKNRPYSCVNEPHEWTTR